MMNWNKLTKACLSMDMNLIGNNISMIEDYKAKDGLSESDLGARSGKPTYTETAEFHAVQSRAALQKIQRFIVHADEVLNRGSLQPADAVLLHQGFKGAIVDAANCLNGTILMIREMSGKKMTSTEDAGQYLAQRFPEAGAGFAVFSSGVMGTLSAMGSVLIQQQGKLRVFNSGNEFEFSLETAKGQALQVEPIELCSDNGLVEVLPFLFVLLLHLAKALDLTVKYYLLANSNPATYAKAAAWYAESTPDMLDDLPAALAQVFEKSGMDEALFAGVKG